MKTIRVVAAVIRKDDRIFATQRGYEMCIRDRVDDGEGRQARFGVAAYEQAVHDIIERLNELCQHDRRRDFE